ncbi:MAG: glycosyltransferase family 4 protein [Vicinamibacterales bacterium]
MASTQYGGVAYGAAARAALGEVCDVTFEVLAPRRIRWRPAKPLEMLVNMYAGRSRGDYVIKDDMVLAALAPERSARTVAVIYHIDESTTEWPYRPVEVLLNRIAARRLRRARAVIAISRYWHDALSDLGLANVHVIYPGFDLEEFAISDDAVRAFRETYGLGSRPIVYIGNCQRAKGVVEVYEALKDLDVELVTSGSRQVTLPARHLDLPRADYLRLLRASDVAITMSRFKEGWCMTAHEAMLLGVPVIGSGRGGMRELLEGGAQTVCPTVEGLRDVVRALLADPGARREQGARGRAYARQFTRARFNEAWQAVALRALAGGAG